MKISSILTKSLTSLLAIGLLTTATFAQDEERIPDRGKKGTVTIITKPEGAKVYLDGDSIGITPIENLEFKSGRHPIKIYDVTGKYEVVNSKFNVWPDSNNVYNSDVLTPQGSIKVVTKGNCKVFLDTDDNWAGNTEGGSLKINSVASGDHKVMIKCGGGKMIEKMVKVESGKVKEIKVGVK
jgi:hypothetical protein